MLIKIQLASLIAMGCAIYGSHLFTQGIYRFGSMMFMVGNTTYIMIGLAVGNLGIVFAQIALSVFAIQMYRGRIFNIALLVYAAALFVILGVSKHQHFHMGLWEATGTVLASYGAYLMTKEQYQNMTLAWVIADLVFVWVAIHEGLVGLFVQSVMFVHHGFHKILHENEPYH